MAHEMAPQTPRPKALPPALRLLERLVGGVTGVALALSAAGILVSLVLVVYAVAMRYVFLSAPTWVDDTVAFIMVGTVMLAAAATQRQGRNISVDMLTVRLGPRGKVWAEAWALLTVAAVAVILIVNGWETAMDSKLFGVVTDGNIGMPVWWLQLFMPLGGVFLLLVTVEALIRLAAGVPTLASHAHHPEEVEE